MTFGQNCTVGFWAVSGRVAFSCSASKTDTNLVKVVHACSMVRQVSQPLPKKPIRGTHTDMKFDDYERSRRADYAAFGEVVAAILTSGDELKQRNGLSDFGILFAASSPAPGRPNCSDRAPRLIDEHRGTPIELGRLLWIPYSLR